LTKKFVLSSGHVLLLSVIRDARYKVKEHCWMLVFRCMPSEPNHSMKYLL